MTAHWMNADDARVLFSDLAWGKTAAYVEWKGTTKSGETTSRVLKVKTGHNGKTWLRLETGPGQLIGEGAAKPKGDPDTVINVPMSTWESRKLAHAVLSYLQAHLTASMITDHAPSGFEPPPDDNADQW